MLGLHHCWTSRCRNKGCRLWDSELGLRPPQYWGIYVYYVRMRLFFCQQRSLSRLEGCFQGICCRTWNWLGVAVFSLVDGLCRPVFFLSTPLVSQLCITMHQSFHNFINHFITKPTLWSHPPKKYCTCHSYFEGRVGKSLRNCSLRSILCSKNMNFISLNQFESSRMCGRLLR